MWACPYGIKQYDLLAFIINSLNYKVYDWLSL